MVWQQRVGDAENQLAGGVSQEQEAGGRSRRPEAGAGCRREGGRRRQEAGSTQLLFI